MAAQILQMPIDYSIDHNRRLVIATGRGKLTDRDVFGYQREVWSKPEVAGYDELMDMSGVSHIALESVGRMMQLAQVSAGMDSKSQPSKFAIVAPGDEAFGLGRMYQNFREQVGQSTKTVGVFRSLTDALKFFEGTNEAT